MTFEGRFVTQMLDGTIKQINPLTGMEVWSVPGRAAKPIANVVPPTAHPLPKLPAGTREDYCNFCENRYHMTPAEKARLVWESGKLVMKKHLLPREAAQGVAAFRRIPNLFEIVTVDYWQKNYTYDLSPENRAWRDRYLADAEGKRHVMGLIEQKLKLLGRTQDEIDATPEAAKLAMTDAFFGGCHELIVAHRHFKEGAEYDSDLRSSGELTPDEHYA
jgi:galactose-1-phosphate uridylyltransferase